MAKAKPKKPVFEFTVEPGVGALPIKFGMTAKQVAAELGKPESKQVNWLGNTNENRFMSNIRVGYSKETELVFDMSCCKDKAIAVMFQGIDLLHDNSRFEVLLKADGEPMELLGFLVFPKLGIGLSGYHGRMAKTVSVYDPSTVDLAKYKPYDPKLLLKLKK